MVNSTEESPVSVWAERGTKHGSGDGSVEVFLTDNHLVVRVGGTCHRFTAPGLEPDGRRPGDYDPETTEGRGQFEINVDEVLEGDGFLLSFLDNAEADERLLFVSSPSDDYAFNCGGLAFEFHYCDGSRSGHVHD